MPGDNFYSLQDDWKVEIDEMLEAIRFREQVKLIIHLPTLADLVSVLSNQECRFGS